MAVFDWMLDGGAHDRLDRMNDELDVLIEDQEKTNTSLEETNDNLKEINETLQEIRDKVETANPGAGMTPGLACGLRDLSFVLRIRRRVCGLLSSPTCPDSSGIHALGRRSPPSGRLGRRAPVASPSDAVPMSPRGFE